MIRRLVIGAVTVAWLALWVMSGRALAEAPRAPLGPCSGTTTARQSPSGSVSACLVVGSLAPGPHTVSAEQSFGFNPLRALLQKVKLLEEHDPAAARKLLASLTARSEPAVTLTVSPASGPPGTRVTVIGHLAEPVSRRDASLQFCWDGCFDGLEFTGGGPLARWTSATSFRAHLTVPAAPWIEGEPARVIPLTSGGYSISVQCVVSKTSCGLSTPEGNAVFTLRSSGPPAWCPNSSDCGVLHVAPGSARPGGTVRVSGHLPLAAFVGPGQPLNYQLSIRRGRPHGPQLRLSVHDGLTTATVGHAALRVRSSPTFASLGSAVAPLAQTTGGLSAVASDPADPSVVAWCGDGTIGISRSGASSSISTATATTTLESMGFEVSSGSSAPTCSAVAPVPGAIVAAFAVGLKPYGAPPTYEVALQSSDGGAVWTPIPVPPGAAAEDFGGFRFNGGALQAVYSAAGPSQPGAGRLFPVLQDDHPLAETTTDGGVTWTAGPLGCPAVGPCVTLSPIVVGNCAMGFSSQSLLRSTDGGAQWSLSPALGGVQPCGEVELTVAAGGSELVLVNSLSPFVLSRSQDGGVSWQDVLIPRVDSFPGPAGVGAGPGGITVLPDGGLLLTGELPYWALLRPGSRTWCRVSSVPDSVQLLGEQQTPLTVIGDQLWWLEATSATDPTPVPRSLSAASIGC